MRRFPKGSKRWASRTDLSGSCADALGLTPAAAAVPRRLRRFRAEDVRAAISA
jgi:hypothetical protein